MIDATIKIIDRFIQLFTLEEKNREKYFYNFVEPMYADAETVVGDYIELFRKLISRLENNDDVAEIIRWLEERRLELLPLRIKLRAFLKSDDYRRSDVAEESFDRFQKGIWGLMKGGLSLVEEGHTPLREYGWGDHTVLDLLYKWSAEPVSANRHRYVSNARQQLKCIEKAWEDVTQGYAEIKGTLV